MRDNRHKLPLLGHTNKALEHLACATEILAGLTFPNGDKIHAELIATQDTLRRVSALIFGSPHCGPIAIHGDALLSLARDTYSKGRSRCEVPDDAGVLFMGALSTTNEEITVKLIRSFAFEASLIPYPTITLQWLLKYLRRENVLLISKSRRSGSTYVVTAACRLNGTSETNEASPLPSDGSASGKAEG